MTIYIDEEHVSKNTINLIKAVVDYCGQIDNEIGFLSNILDENYKELSHRLDRLEKKKGEENDNSQVR